MKKGDLRRQQILERLADYVLEHGLQSASLRPLAAAANTSDRMLLHYFADKEELLTATLTLVSQRLMAILAHAQATPQPVQQLIPYLTVLINNPTIQPYLRLWLELAALAANHQEPFRTVARQISDSFLQWIETTLVVDHETHRAPVAAFALSMIEGMVLFEAVGNHHTRELALYGLQLQYGG